MIGAANSPNKTRVPARVFATRLDAGSTEKETPVVGPNPLPIIVIISPGATAPDIPLAECTIEVTITRGADGAIAVRLTVTLCGRAPGAVNEITPLYVPAP